MCISDQSADTHAVEVGIYMTHVSAHLVSLPQHFKLVLCLYNVQVGAKQRIDNFRISCM